MDWKEEFDEKFKLQTKSNNAYIQNISELIIDIKDYIENLLAEERKKVAEEIISIIEGNGYNEWRTRDLKGLYAFTDEGLEQLKLIYGIKESE